MFLLLLIPIVQACDFVELPDISVNPHQIYVVRNHSSNREWNKGFTLQNMHKTLHSKVIQHALPQTRPADFKSMVFAEFLEKHILWYDTKPLNTTKEHRAIMTFDDYPRHDIFGDIFGSLTNGHSCEHIRTHDGDQWRDYFIGTKGAGVNFHQHAEIFHQLVSGKKLWLILENFSTIQDFHGPRDAIAPKINKIMQLDGVKTCIIGPGDIIHVPQNTIHGIFNLETSISTACLIPSKEEI